MVDLNVVEVSQQVDVHLELLARVEVGQSHLPGAIPFFPFIKLTGWASDQEGAAFFVATQRVRNPTIPNGENRTRPVNFRQHRPNADFHKSMIGMTQLGL